MKLDNIDTRTSGIKMNLQLFAEPNIEGQAPSGHPAQSVSEMIQSILAENATDTGVEPLETVTEQQPIAQPQIEQQPELIQEPVTSPVENEPTVLEKRYKDVQAFATKKSQEAAEYKKQNDELMQQIQLMQQQPAQVQQQTQQDDLTTLDPQAFLDKFYENPQAALQEIVSKFSQPTIDAPVVDYVKNQMKVDKWGNTLKQFKDSVPDYGENEAAIIQFIQENGLGNSDDPQGALEKGYIAARKLNYQPPQASPEPIDPKSFLQDANFVNENILNNPAIVNQILKAQAEKLQQGKPPVSIASTGGQPIATPPNKPTTMEEVKQRVQSIFAGNNG